MLFAFEMGGRLAFKSLEIDLGGTGDICLSRGRSASEFILAWDYMGDAC